MLSVVSTGILEELKERNAVSAPSAVTILDLSLKVGVSPDEFIDSVIELRDARRIFVIGHNVHLAVRD